MEPEPRPLPNGSVNLTSFTDSHAPAGSSSRTRLATDRTPWPSSSQGPVKGSGSPAPRAVTLFRKYMTASSAASPRGVASFARTLPRMPRKLEALAGTGLCGLSREGQGGAVGRGTTYCWSGRQEVILQGPHLGSARVFLVGGGLTCHKPLSSQGLQNREHRQP